MLLKCTINSWAFLFGSGLKIIFHWKAQWLLIYFKLFKEVTLPWHMENQDISSIGIYGRYDKFIDKSSV